MEYLHEMFMVDHTRIRIDFCVCVVLNWMCSFRHDHSLSFWRAMLENRSCLLWAVGFKGRAEHLSMWLLRMQVYWQRNLGLPDRMDAVLFSHDFVYCLFAIRIVQYSIFKNSLGIGKSQLLALRCKIGRQKGKGNRNLLSGKLDFLDTAWVCCGCFFVFFLIFLWVEWNLFPPSRAILFRKKKNSLLSVR